MFILMKRAFRFHQLVLGVSVCAHQGDGKRACDGASCWPNTGLLLRFSVFEITQQSASALSHGLLSLTKHKKCMYN